MITIMPCLEILKSFSDAHIDSPQSKIRVQSFQIANELIAEANAKILIPSQLYERVGLRLNDDQKSAFETLYSIDSSTKTAVPAYDLYQATRLISDVESKARFVIILTENTSSYECANNGRIKLLKPEEFIQKVNVIRALKKRGVISSIDEALIIFLFKN